MATQFISAFIVIGLIVFLGVVAAVGVMNSKANQAKLCKQPHAHGLDSEE
jgi:hypothetical protein